MLRGDLSAELAVRISDMMIHFGAQLVGDLTSDLLDNLNTYGENFNVYLSKYLFTFIPLFLVAHTSAWMEQFFAEIDITD
ncbi:hypothetical protein ACLB2K_022823 [Fragaria x ananassa]